MEEAVGLGALCVQRWSQSCVLETCFPFTREVALCMTVVIVGP